MVLKKLLGTAFLSVLAKLTLLGATIVLARTLGPKQYGEYLYWIAIVNILVAILTSGVPTLLNKLIPSYHVKQSHGHINGLYQALNFLLLITAPFILLSLYHIANFNFTLALAICFLILIKGNLLINASYANAIKFPNFIPTYRYLIPSLLLVITFFYVQKDNVIDSTTAIWTTIIVTLIASILCAVHLRTINTTKNTKRRFTDLSTWVPLFFSLTGISFLTTAGHELSTLIITQITSFEQVAVWKITAQGFFFSLIVNTVINQYLMPLTSEKNSLGRLYESRKDLSQAAIISTLCSIFALLTIALTGDRIVVVLFGDPYREAVTPLVILLGFQVVASLVGPSIAFLSIADMQITALKLSALIFIFYVFSTITLTYNFGITGSAIALGGSFLIHRLGACYCIYTEKQIYTGIPLRGYF